MQVKGQSNGCVFTELLTYFHLAVVFFVKNGTFHHFVRKCFLHINSKISRRDDTKTGVICHNTIICGCQATLPEVVPDFDARERVPGDDQETRQ